MHGILDYFCRFAKGGIYQQAKLRKNNRCFTKKLIFYHWPFSICISAVMQRHVVLVGNNRQKMPLLPSRQILAFYLDE